VDAVRRRAERLAERLGGRVVATVARVGGGALPLTEIASFGVELDGPANERAAAFRLGDPPVVARIEDGALVLDCRTLADEDVDRIPAP
jgi:L-seryl-tRNA(Ser) seleniumtransferase